MNKKVAEMGIDAYYYDSCGIAKNEISPIAMTTLARNIIKDYPDILERSTKTSVNFHGKTYYNLNKMFTDYYYEGADGFKNGMTDASGYCMCRTAELNGQRIITVTLPSENNEVRFTETAKLFDYGFAQ